MIKKILRKEIFFLYLLSYVIILTIPFFFWGRKKAFFYTAILFVVYTLMLELIFIVLYRIIVGKIYHLIPKMPFKQMYIEPHPYLPYVYKKNFLCQKAIPSSKVHLLNSDKGYMLEQLKTNNFRHVNGPKGDRNIEVPKPKGLIRINCLGGSTTAGYLSYKGQNYSYPMELEKILKNTFPEMNIEVNNFGQGGYTTAEILIKFLLNIIDTEPDIVIIYHAYNDLRASMAENFQSDYSHARINLGQVYHLYKLASKIPGIPLASWNFMVNHCLFSQNLRYSIPGAISKNEVNINNDFKGIPTYKRNIKHIINICKANNIKVVLSTFCHYLHSQIRNDKSHLKYNTGIKLENEAMKEIAREYNLPLVENDLLIPREDRFFMDSAHFSHEGMQLLAKNISRPIINYIKELKETA